MSLAEQEGWLRLKTLWRKFLAILKTNTNFANAFDCRFRNHRAVHAVNRHNRFAVGFNAYRFAACNRIRPNADSAASLNRGNYVEIVVDAVDAEHAYLKLLPFRGRAHREADVVDRDRVYADVLRVAPFRYRSFQCCFAALGYLARQSPVGKGFAQGVRDAHLNLAHRSAVRVDAHPDLVGQAPNAGRAGQLDVSATAAAVTRVAQHECGRRTILFSSASLNSIPATFVSVSSPVATKKKTVCHRTLSSVARTVEHA